MKKHGAKCQANDKGFAQTERTRFNVEREAFFSANGNADFSPATNDLGTQTVQRFEMGRAVTFDAKGNVKLSPLTNDLALVPLVSYEPPKFVRAPRRPLFEKALELKRQEPELTWGDIEKTLHKDIARLLNCDPSKVDSTAWSPTRT